MRNHYDFSDADARACRTLGIPFVGVATGARAAILAAEGAARVVPDLVPGDGLLECVASDY